MIRFLLSFNPLKIFISSSWKGDLNQDFDEIVQLIKSMKFQPTTGDMGSESSTKIHSVLRVKNSDILILVLGKLFSETVQAEYYEALENNIPVLAFIKENSERDKELTKFILNLKENLTYSEFSELKDLRKSVRYDLINLISEKFRHYQSIHRIFLRWISDYTLKIPKNILDKLK